ncbi:MAG: Undecaprenyl-phosphate 4-deoxy-4-formamido-L-arabinose transferase [Phycisphaerae bacterium]|nr:Undecaprenyl-phosphate 4-deoxy-4-formamido-L-arabinose transferase [Phycisphaerae bacterium]
MRLTIVIPALNEEGAIESIIRRTLDARAHIIDRSPVSAVEIVVVSDGSTDRTAEIAGRYAAEGLIQLIVFDHNRGYGAAIKAGFERGHGQLVGFLDADGTCDPRFFADLCRAMFEADAHVAIGSRLHRDSRMPRVRRIGNRIYAMILGLLSNRFVTDTASGMRVIRRDVLAHLYPLPDGLNFTPAMSARVLMDGGLRIVERRMPYHERVGRSKLSVLRDGVRFLQTIGQMALAWNPGRVFGTGAAGCLLLMTLLALHPLEQWFRVGAFEEGAIYRLLFCAWLGCVGGVLLSSKVIVRQIAELSAVGGGRDVGGAGAEASIPVPPSGAGASMPGTSGSYVGHLLDRVYTLPVVSILAGVALVPLTVLIGPGLWTRLTDGRMTVHWSRVVLAGLIAFNLAQILATTLVTNALRFHAERRRRASDAPVTPIGAPSVEMLAESCTPRGDVAYRDSGGQPSRAREEALCKTEPRP